MEENKEIKNGEKTLNRNSEKNNHKEKTEKQKDYSEILKPKGIIIEKLSDDKKSELIYKQATRIHDLENKIKNKTNPISILSDNTDNLISLISGVADKWLEFKKTNLKFTTTMSVFAFMIILLIVGSAGWLTYLGKIDGSTFTFLLGLIVGYALTFLQNMINTSE